MLMGVNSNSTLALTFYGNAYQLFFCVLIILKRLKFPYEVIEDGRESAKYDVSAGEITVKLPKAEKGTFFLDLDIISKFMVTSANGAGPNPFTISSSDQMVDMKELSEGAVLVDNLNPVGRPFIEVIGDSKIDGHNEDESNNNDIKDDEDEDEDGDNDHINWDIPQNFEQVS